VSSSALLAALWLGAPCAWAPAQAQTIGRLFATPLERATLDANRGKALQGGQAGGDPLTGQQGLQGQPGAGGTPTDAGGAGGPGGPGYGGGGGGGGGGGSPGAAAAAPTQDALVMNGVLRSSSGRSTVWLNNVPQSGAQNKLSTRGKKSQALTVTLPSGKKVILQAGQRYDVNDGRVKDINEP
jgi:hypothetical protein